MADTTWLASTTAKASAGTLDGNEEIRVIDDPAGTPASKKTTPSAIRTYILGLASTWSAAQKFAGGTIAAPGITAGAAQTGMAVDSATSSQLSLVYAGTEHARIGFNQMSSFAQLFAANSIGGAPVNLILGTSATASFPGFKRSATIAQCKLGDDSAFAPLQGKLRTDSNATTGLSAGVLAASTNASIEITDASGQLYRVPCII